jgi:hypothetical protein
MHTFVGCGCDLVAGLLSGCWDWDGRCKQHGSTSAEPSWVSLRQHHPSQVVRDDADAALTQLGSAEAGVYAASTNVVPSAGLACVD